jgi:hypothetical protein
LLPDKVLNILKAFREASRWEDSGEVVLRSGTETGRVFFAHGKIAWATASTIKKFFIAYMVEAAKLDEGELKKVFEECKRTGRNFGEVIVERGLLDEPTLRELLLQQIAESMLEMLAWTSVDSMFMPEHRTYKGSLTFEIAEVLQRVLALDTDRRLPFHDMSVADALAEAEKFAAAPQPPVTPASAPAAPAVARKKSPLAARAAGGAIGVGFWLRVHSDSAAVAVAPSPRSLPLPSTAPALDAAAPEVVVDSGSAAIDAGIEEPGAGAGLDAGAPPPTIDPAWVGGIVALAAGDGEGLIRVASTPPGAIIYLDGVATGRTAPTLLTNVAAGREHVILLIKDDAAAHAKVSVTRDQTADVKLAVTKKSKPGRVMVRVESEPSGARVLLDGNPLKQATPVEISLSAAKISKLVVIHDGFEPWVRIVRAVPEIKLTYFAKLEWEK